MQNTIDIFHEISALREQIATVDAAITRGKNDDVEIKDLMEARESMIARLSRLESCKRTPGT